MSKRFRFSKIRLADAQKGKAIILIGTALEHQTTT